MTHKFMPTETGQKSLNEVKLLARKKLHHDYNFTKKKLHKEQVETSDLYELLWSSYTGTFEAPTSNKYNNNYMHNLFNKNDLKQILN